jgi:hypothetical protein
MRNPKQDPPRSWRTIIRRNTEYRMLKLTDPFFPAVRRPPLRHWPELWRTGGGPTIRFLLITTLVFIAFFGCRHEPDELTLFDFETDADLNQIYWKCHTLFSISSEHATSGTKSLKMELYPSTYPGFAGRLSRNNWSGYKTLCFDIYNPNEDRVSITVRIDDRKEYPDYEDRYNEAFALSLGSNHVEIPLDPLSTSSSKRRLDTRHIERFLIYAVNPGHKIVFYLDSIRLIR